METEKNCQLQFLQNQILARQLWDPIFIVVFLNTWFFCNHIFLFFYITHSPLLQIAYLNCSKYSKKRLIFPINYIVVFYARNEMLFSVYFIWSIQVYAVLRVTTLIIRQYHGGEGLSFLQIVNSFRGNKIYDTYLVLNNTFVLVC